MQHHMIDIETLALSPRAMILSVGIVAVNRNSSGTYAVNGFAYWVANIAKNDPGKYEIDPQTVLWWLRQSDVARADFNRLATIHIRDVLICLNEFIQLTPNHEDALIWAKPPKFDLAILEHAYQTEGIDCPWSYKQLRCLRTAIDMFDPDDTLAPPDHGTHHNALDNAKYQAEYLAKLLNVRDLCVGE